MLTEVIRSQITQFSPQLDPAFSVEMWLMLDIIKIRFCFVSSRIPGLKESYVESENLFLLKLMDTM